MPEELHINVRLEDGSFWATIDELPGVFGTGDTLEELRESLEEGISLYLAKPGEVARAVRLQPFQDGAEVTSAVLAYA